MAKNPQFGGLHDAAEPALSDTILTHLGQILAKTYAPEHDGAAKLSRLAALLEKLDAALALSKNRDAEAFRAGLLEAAPMLQRFATSLTRDPGEADDLVQDTMLRAWRSRSRFSVGTNLNAWLFTIMRNSFYSKYRKTRFEVVNSEDSSLINIATLPEQAGAVDLADVRNALKKLAAPMREALTLVTVEGLSYEEAAEVMGCKIGTVKSRVWRARDDLVRLLGFTGAEIGNSSDMLGAMNRYGSVSSDVGAS